MTAIKEERHGDSDSDIELEIEGEGDLTLANSNFLKELKGRLNEASGQFASEGGLGGLGRQEATSSNRPPGGSDEIDRLFADWQVQLPYSCKLTLEDVTLSEQPQSEVKSFVLQVLKDKEGMYGLLCRWTAVGGRSDHSIVKTASLEEAISLFKERFYEKTFNQWSQRETFRLKPGAYRWLGNYKDARPGLIEDEVQANPEKAKLKYKLRIVNIRGQTQPSSILDRQLLEALRTLFNMEESESLLDSYSVDKTKLWISDIEMKNVLRAHKTLADIEYQIFSAARKNQKIFELSTEFNRLVPQQFKVSTNQMIDDVAKLRLAHKLLIVLTGICAQVSLVKHIDYEESSPGQPLDDLYRAMDCQLRPLPQIDNQVFSQIKAMMTAHGETHEHMKLHMLSVFDIQKEGLFQSFFPFRQLKRRMLWLGASSPNIVEYLTRGLSIVKTESPSSVGFFGKALYFTDVVSKAAKHCGNETAGRTAFLLLCEVATGNEYKVESSKVFSKPPKGFHCVKGQGKYESPESTDMGGARGSVGVPVRIESAIDSSFLYNEFAVFDEQQAKPAYLVRVQFGYS